MKQNEIDEIIEILQENIKDILARKRYRKFLTFTDLELLSNNTNTLIQIKNYLKERED